MPPKLNSSSSISKAGLSNTIIIQCQDKNSHFRMAFHDWREHCSLVIEVESTFGLSQIYKVFNALQTWRQARGSKTMSHSSTTFFSQIPSSEAKAQGTSDYSLAHDRTVSHNHMAELYRRIGQGFCGTVWSDPTGLTDTLAMKREDGGPGRSLYNDYLMHQAALQSLLARPSKIFIPSCHQYISPGHQAWWCENLPRFPPEFQIPCNTLLTDRIPPFSKIVRDTLIDLYCPEALKTSIRSSLPDEDCLIRPYLGRRRRAGMTQSRFKAFSLRNSPLHVDQMEELGLDGALYAQVMAETLAVLYWEARIDANDVEFVLAPAPVSRDHSVSSEEALDRDTVIKSCFLGEHVVWILDFDCCRTMSLNERGVEQAVAAFWRNDPYYPRPRSGNVKDESLWTVFRETFLDTSGAILRPESPEASLPTLWIDLVEQRGKL